MALTLLSAGTPMLLMGDEGRRTQGGNNNPYCQNNEISWLDWKLLGANAELKRFVVSLILMRLGSEVDGTEEGLTLEQYQAKAHYEWHGTALGQPDWSDDSHAIAFTLHTTSLDRWVYVAVNGFWEAQSFELPEAVLGWRRIVDTSLAAPDDIAEFGRAVAIAGTHYFVNARSMVVLETNVR